MKIRIRYFASLREVVGQSEETLDMPDGSSVSGVRAALEERYPGLRAILARCVAAINQKYGDAETALHEGDELVFIPPMGGGAEDREIC